jgi:hypothetical protein
MEADTTMWKFLTVAMGGLAALVGFASPGFAATVDLTSGTSGVI